MSSFDDSIAGALGNTNAAAPDIQDQTGPPDNATLPASAQPPQPTAFAQTSVPTSTAQAQQEPQPPALIHPNHRSFFGAVASALVGGTLAAASKTTKALAGPAPVEYSVDPSGKTIATPREDSTSSRLQRIARAALEGLASGAMVSSGPNRGAQWAKGIGAGAEAGYQRRQQEDLLKREQAKEQFDEQQKALTTRATIWKYNMERYKDYLEAAKLEADMNPEWQETESIKDSIEQSNADTPGYEHQYKILSPEAAQAFLLPQQQKGAGAHTADTHPLGQWLLIGAMSPVPVKGPNNEPLFNEDGSVKTQSRVLIVSADEKGKWALPPAFADNLQRLGDALPGNLKNVKAGDFVDPKQFALMRIQYMKAKAAVDREWKVDKIKKADGTEGIVSYNPLSNQTHEGTLGGGLIYYLDSKTGKWYVTDPRTNKKTETDASNVPITIQNEYANLASTKAGTFEKTKAGEKDAEQTRQLQEWDTNGPDGNGRVDAFGNPVGALGMDKNEYKARVKAYTKDYAKDLGQLDNARSQLAKIIYDADKTGILPGAAAVVGIFDAIGISSAPLKGRGFRINSQVIGEHVEGTRNIWQGMGLKLARVSPDGTGQIVSLQQLKEYEKIMNDARLDAYVGAAQDALNRGIGIQTIPRGFGQPIDPNTAKIFRTLAKGDPVKAAALELQYDWTLPK